ncbi:MAG: amidohydrolase/deacetylase family metallohydrolase [Acidobacteria bacterium]|nr:MAG: amidohydrolase/deacetylase family metallohydrolase [Acidobacteriota bacterium]
MSPTAPVSRRTFLGTLAAGAATAWAAEERYDIVIRGGELCDPSQKLRRRAALGIRDGKIAAVEPDIPASRGIQAIDAKGSYVTPGLVDLHTHCYFGATGLGIEPDPIAARSGVTTWVDAGSFGHDQVEGFRRFIVAPSKARIFGYVYLYPSSRNPDVAPVDYVRRGMRSTGEAAVKNRDIILGVKVQIGSNMNGRYSLDFLKIARELCDKYMLPLMTHISFSPPETDQVMELMRPGDVVTHCYNGHTLGIVDANGKIKPSVLEARARGVLFDVGHGLGSFNFEAARKALAAGFVADTISTDIYNLNVNGPVFDLPTTMSKLMHLGMTFEDVLLRVTAAPAKIVNRVPLLGTLAVGAPSDVALLQVEEGEFQLVDSQRNKVDARRRVVCRETICRGKAM